MMLTIDVETDWGTGGTRGVREVLPRLLERLEQRGCRATFFVVGELAEQVRPHLDPGGPHEVGSHGLTHALLPRLSPAQVEHEVFESRRRLQQQGYRVAGFRSPFLRGTPELPALLGRAGYRYDSSLGSVVPSLRNAVPRRAVECHGIQRLRPSTLRPGLVPFSLTYLRLLHPWGRLLRPARASMFYGHLHELLDGAGGWRPLPGPLRRLHARNAGGVAWRILDELLAVYGSRTETCSEHLGVVV